MSLVLNIYDFLVQSTAKLRLLRIYKSLRQYKVIVKQLPQANAMSTEMSVAMQQDIHPIESV